MRIFNTSGPNIPAKHYTLLREELIEKGIQLVQNERYFTIWAPRQSGKSTYFRLLAQKLEGIGYITCQVILGNFLSTNESELLNSIGYDIELALGIEVRAKKFSEFYDILRKINDKKFVFIVDEVEGLNPDILGQFLHTIRNLYHSRESHCLKSVILVGVSNIVGIIQDNASPFNIADTLEMSYFTNEETFSLLEQHENETGQLFAKIVKSKISEITANQPGLVNAFARKLVDDYPQHQEITYDEYLKVEDWFLRRALDKNFAHILNKSAIYRSFLEKLLFRDAIIPFEIGREEIKFLHTLGLITDNEEGNVIFWVPFYKKRLYKEFYPYTNGEQEIIQGNLLLEDYKNAKGTFDFAKIIRGYQDYVKRRGFNYFREKDKEGNYKSLKETALMYSFETYIQAFIQEADGKSYREADTGLGKSDLIVNLDGEEVLIESKIYYSPNQFKKGKPQLAYYCQSLGLQEGIYLVFVSNQVRQHKELVEKNEEIAGITIYTYLVHYDEDKDF